MTRQEIQARLDKIEREADAIIQSIPYGRGGSPEQEARLDELHDEHVRLWKEYRGTAPEPEPDPEPDQIRDLLRVITEAEHRLADPWLTAPERAELVARIEAARKRWSHLERKATEPEPEPELVRLPSAFFFDHEARDLPTPTVVRETKSHVWIRRDAPELPELVSDARYYADPSGFDPDIQRTLCRSARALLAALDRTGAWTLYKPTS